MEFNQVSRWFIYLGIGFIAAGFVFWLISKITSAKNFPGTLQFELGGVTCVFPILLSIVLSVVLTVVLNLIGRLLNK